jgi:DNA-binding LacI/PurR family transcriptional regulator
MKFELQSHARQVADALRSEILIGKWRGYMPGILALENELCLNRNLLGQALLILEEEGILVPQGKGKPRKIVIPKTHRLKTLRIGIIEYQARDVHRFHPLAETKYLLEAAGHSVTIAQGNLAAMNMNPKRVSQAISKHDVDAWVVVSGSKSLLEWFAEQPFPALSFFGIFNGVKIASVVPAVHAQYQVLVRKLLELGHRKIVFISRSTTPAMMEREMNADSGQRGVLARELSAHGIAYGDYNLPCFESDPERLQQCLHELFRVTPPTAIYVDEAFVALVVYEFLLKRGIRVPADVSLVCNIQDPAFEWNRPVISHFRWDPGAIGRRVLQWADNVARGKEDLRQVSTKVTFVEGGTIAPARK